MLASTLRKNIKIINKYDNDSRLSKYSSLTKCGSSESLQNVDEIIVKDKIEEMFDESYIVDDPSQLIVKFPIILDIHPDKKLPFFKSVTYKLEKIFS